MSRRQVYSVVVSFLALFVFANFANAQSQDKEHPTPLTSNKISSPIYADNRNEFFYYSFMAGPGDVTISLNVEPDRSGGTNQVQIKLLAENGESLGEFGIYTWMQARREVKRITLRRRQKVTMEVFFTEANTLQGKYEMVLRGAIEVGQDSTGGGTFNIPNDKTGGSECLPKQGTLIIKMKDGSKKIIDLSEAESITVVP